MELTYNQALELLRKERAMSKKKKVELFFFLNVNHGIFIPAPKGTTMKTDAPFGLEVTSLYSILN